MDIGKVFNVEMDICTGKIISFFCEGENVISKEEAVKFVGDVLHESKRRMLKMMEEERHG